MRAEVSSEDQIVVNYMFSMELVIGRGIPGDGPVLPEITLMPEKPLPAICRSLGT